MSYESLSEYFKRIYGKRLKKICIDGGFTCPNRDGRCGEGGCIFCGERGAGEHIDPTIGIREQVERGLFGTCEGELFVAYFQNFTNTYAPVEVLRGRYDAALIDERIRVLAIGTRPDCIDEEVAALIASYRERVDVWVELGLQTADDEVGKLINRGYGRAEFDRAARLLSAYGIPIVAHMIIGLPGEGKAEALKTVEFLNGYELFGLKIHSIYVMRGTHLSEMYERGEFVPPTREEYIDTAVSVIRAMRPGTVVHRLTGDCPRGMLVAPEWSTDKNGIISEIRKRLGKE